jgi:hypothetical protein
MDNNGDGSVDLSDFMVWSEQVGSGRSAGAAAAHGQDYGCLLEDEERLCQLKVCCS